MSDNESDGKKEEKGKLRIVTEDNIDEFNSSDIDFTKAENELKKAIEEIEKHRNKPDPDDIA